MTLVIARPRNTLSKRGPGSRDSCRSRQSVAPDVSAIRVSQIEASKLNDANCRTRLSGRTSKTSTCARARLHNPPCSNKTPFGLPVDPEV